MRRAILFLFLLAGCAPANGPHKPIGGDFEGKAGDQGSAGYESVKSIFAQHCAACHPSRSGPDWLDYNQASVYAQNGKLLRRVAVERSMPPPGSSQAASISDSERAALASWARAGGPRESKNGRSAAQAPAAKELTGQEKLVQSCLHCHGANGPDPSAEQRIPLLAGQNLGYLISQLRKFKWRERVDPSQSMNDIAIHLSDKQIADVAGYFASRDAHIGSGGPALPPAEREIFLRGQKLAESNCISCHRNREFGNRPTSDLLPSLDGQSKIYLINQLIYFRGDERANPLMRELAQELKNSDIEALATYFANVH